MQELSGTTPTANLLTGLGVDEVFIRTDSAGARNFLAGALGSTVALTDSAGALQTQYTHEPFGSTNFSGPAGNNSYQYTGRENDGTGLYYYRARYYSPSIQRFTSEDSPEFLGLDFNAYVYVRNNPIALIDPMGLTPIQGWTTVNITVGAATFSIERDDYGNVYVSGGVAVSLPLGVGGSVMRGSLDDNPFASAKAISDHLTSSSFSGCVGFLLGGCKAYSPNARPWNRWSSSVGLSTPEVSLGWQYGWKWTRLSGRKQDYNGTGEDTGGASN